MTVQANDFGDSPTIAELNSMPELDVYPLTNYDFDSKEAIKEKDLNVKQRFHRLNDEYMVYGPRRSFEAVFVAHERKFPHILLFQLSTNFYKLPGGELSPNEDEITGINRILNYYLSANESSVEWKPAHIVSKWYRPSSEPPQYPYIPPQINEPKEEKTVYLMRLPENLKFVVPKNYKLVAAPLFELYNNQKEYGYIISSLPIVLSSYKMNNK